MALINKIVVDNLKSIKHLELSCGSVNLLVGTNSSGKSTVIQAVLVMLQNMTLLNGLNGELVALGSFEECRCRFSPHKEIRIGIEIKNGCFFEIAIAKAASGKVVLDSKCGSTEEDIQLVQKALNYNMRQIQYLSCHRIGPQRLYEKNMSMTDWIGVDGRYAISFLNQHGTDPLSLELCRDSENYTLLGQVNHWLKYIVNVEISTEEVAGADMINVSYRMNEVEAVRPGNIGSGISYLVSILIMCLSAPQGGILIVENPEIHLHPSAQAKLCKFFYFIAEAGRQIFLESHSDHIFNGFRAGIVAGDMAAQKINIQFLALEETGETVAERVEIGKYGKILNQRKDLFDQFDIDLNRMLKL